MYTTTKKEPFILFDRKGPRTTTSSFTPTVEVYRSDTVRRRKPSVLWEHPTSVYTIVKESFPAGFHSKSADGFYEALTDAANYGGRGRVSDSSYVSRATLLCENKARAKFRSGGVNLAQLFAEYKQAANLFPTLGRRAYDILRTFRTRRRAALLFGRDPTRLISNDLLVYLYGVKPLMSDMYDSYEEMRSAAKTWRPRRTITATHNEYHDESPTWWPLRYQSSTKIDNTRLGAARVKCRYEVFYNASAVTDFAARHGLLNPLALAWELIPYSFIVDWWIGVGESLESLDNLSLVSSNIGYTSTFVNEQCIVGGKLAYRYIEKRRTHKALSLISVPTYKAKNSGSHILATLALLRGLKKG